MFLKLKQKKNMKIILFYGFYFKTQKWPVWGSINFFHNFFSFSFLNNRHTNVIWSVFLKMHKKPLLITKNGQNGVFDG